MNPSHLTLARSAGASFLLALAISTQAKDIHEPGESELESRASIEIVRHAVSQAKPIRESAFVYDLNRDDFDLSAYLDRRAPHLKPHEDAIAHWSGFASIHPRIVLALIESRSELISQPTDAALERPFGTLSDEIGFQEQLGDVVTRLSQRFYNLKGMQRKTGLSPFRQGIEPKASAASLAMASVMSENNRSLQSGNPLDAFEERFNTLFPEKAATLRGAVTQDRTEPSLTRKSDSNSLTQKSDSQLQWNSWYNSFTPPDNMMQMPWRQGYWWIPNGAHAHTGSGYPLSSIDVSYDWPRWGEETYSVAAAHSGTVRVFSRCQVRVTNPNGWATNYYHLEGIQVRDGQWVNRNTKLADYADDRGNALCQGGSSTGPHLHFSLLYNGQYRSLQDVNLGPYKIDVGRWSYDDNCYNYWLYNEYQNRYICAWNSIYNYGAKR